MHCPANNQNWQIMQDGPAYNQCVVLSKQTFVNLLTYFPVILVKKHTYTTLSWVILVWPVDSLTLHLFLFTRQAKTCQVILKKKHGSTRSSLDVSSAEFRKAPTSQSRADNDETRQFSEWLTDLVDGDDVLQFALLRQESPLAFQLFVADVEQLLVVEQQILHDADLGRQRHIPAVLPFMHTLDDIQRHLHFTRVAYVSVQLFTVCINFFIHLYIHRPW